MKTFPLAFLATYTLFFLPAAIAAAMEPPVPNDALALAAGNDDFACDMYAQ